MTKKKLVSQTANDDKRDATNKRKLQLQCVHCYANVCLSGNFIHLMNNLEFLKPTNCFCFNELVRRRHRELEMSQFNIFNKARSDRRNFLKLCFQRKSLLCIRNTQLKKTCIYTLFMQLVIVGLRNFAKHQRAHVKQNKRSRRHSHSIKFFLSPLCVSFSALLQLIIIQFNSHFPHGGTEISNCAIRKALCCMRIQERGKGDADAAALAELVCLW
jgi:hypothetical protein